MNPDIKARWIVALRDPNARQIFGWLADRTGGRCCLGVLCDLAVADGVIGKPDVLDDPDDPHMSYPEGDNSNRYASELPHAVREWAGVFSGNPEAGSRRLAWWNDVDEKTFPEIADLIEKYL